MAETTVEQFARSFQLVLAAILLASVIPKLRSPSRFISNVAAYAIVPRNLLQATAFVLIGVEAYLGLSLLAGWMLVVVLPVTVATFCGFAVAVGINLQRGRNVPCGCFGDASDQISARTLVRLLSLLALCIVLVVASRVWAIDPPTMEASASAGQAGVRNLIESATFAAALIASATWALRVWELVILRDEVRDMRTARKNRELRLGSGLAAERAVLK